MTQAGDTFCSQHTPEALAIARARSLAAQPGVRPADVEEDARQKYRRLESTHRTHPTPGAAAPFAAQQWADPEAPLHLDIGCARGRWVLGLAEEPPSGTAVNHVGVEIRAPLVDEANAAAASRGLGGRVRYVAVDMARDATARSALLEAVRPTLRCVSVMFPDPYPPKRRDPDRSATLTAALARALAAALPPGGAVFVASDKEHVARDMCATLAGTRLGAAEDGEPGMSADEGTPCFRRVGDDAEAERALARALGPALAAEGPGGSDGAEALVAEEREERWLGRNVWRRPTEREAVCEQPDRRGEPRTAHRALFVRV